MKRSFRGMMWGSTSGMASLPLGNEAKKDGGATSTSGTHIYFYEDINQSAVARLAEKLRELDLSLRTDFLKYDGEIKPPPIHLHVHSYGGSVLAGWAAADMVKRLNVHTHIEGGAASAATFLTVSGAHRTISPNSHILIHQVSTWFSGKADELADAKKNIDRFMNQLVEFYTKHTKIPEDTIREIMKHDLWFSAEQALEHGLVDEII